MKVEQANKIILNPFITEKTFELVEAEKKICFIVEKTAKKPEIKEAIKVLYNENVIDVKIVKELSVLDLAPGASPIRLTVYSKSALDDIAKIKSSHLELMVTIK